MSERRTRDDLRLVWVRPARLSDLEAIRAIYNEAVRNTTATFDTRPRTGAEQRDWFHHHDPRHPVVVAVRGDRIVGWASLSRWSDRQAYDDTAEVSVYVGAAHRGHRIGSRLLREVLAEGRRRRLRTVLARIAERNPVSRRLHVSAGFVPVGVMHRVGRKFGRVLDVELLELPLRSRR